jgi:eukaryotic-like serine/threonine-protein kinase
MSEPSLESVIADFIEQKEAGLAPDPYEFLDRYPQHADELALFFRNQDWISAADPTPPADLIGRTLGPFRIESELARGGMGVVYRATQEGLGRVVALKVINTGLLAGAEERRRFRIEAEAAASLDHPAIVPIYSIGCEEGWDYFAMRLIEGPTLQSWIDQHRNDIPRICTIVRDLARAVQYAHDRGVIHRDLKPDNILLDENENPHLTDFGLARWHRGDASMTRSGQVLGTPHYMSPQQASGVTEIDHRADVYSLGAILYALLAGRPPHTGDGLAEVLRSVLQDEPHALRSLCRGLPTPLERICHRAIRYDLHTRYQTANELADDLQRFLDGEPIESNNRSIVRRMVEEIDRDRHQSQFLRWSSSLWHIGIIIMVAHATIYLLRRFDQPDSIAYWLPRLAMMIAIGARILYARGGSLIPRTVAERPVWSIWIGYLTVLGSVNALSLAGVIETQALFPLTSLLSGFGFIAMAGHVWGVAGLFGLGFILIAGICVWIPSTAPLWFGSMWLISLGTLATHYRRAGNLGHLTK